MLLLLQVTIYYLYSANSAQRTCGIIFCLPGRQGQKNSFQKTCTGIGNEPQGNSAKRKHQDSSAFQIARVNEQPVFAPWEVKPLVGQEWKQTWEQ